MRNDLETVQALVKLAMQVFLSLIVAFTCVYEISTSQDKSFWQGTLAFTIGLWFPSPTDLKKGPGIVAQVEGPVDGPGIVAQVEK